MTEGSIITDEMRAVLDKESEPWTVEVERGAVRQFARSAGYTNPVYYDIDAARAAGYPDLPCPPGFFGRDEFLPGKSDPTFSNPVHAGHFPVGEFKNILNGGMQTKIYRRIFAGETLTASSKWTDVREREGSIGKMLIVSNVITYHDRDGKVVGTAGETTIRYR